MGSDNGPRRYGRARRRLRLYVAIAFVGATLMVWWGYISSRPAGSGIRVGEGGPAPQEKPATAQGAPGISGGFIPGAGGDAAPEARDRVVPGAGGAGGAGGSGSPTPAEAERAPEHEEAPAKETEEEETIHETKGDSFQGGGGKSGFTSDPCQGMEWEGFDIPPIQGEGGEEKWWGGIVQRGMEMPYKRGWKIHLGETWYNQGNPVLVSNKGRYIWSDIPRRLMALKDGTICVEGADDDFRVGSGHGDVRGAFLEAHRNHFAPSSTFPDPLLFTAPQYNLWIECLYEPTQVKVLEYAKQVIEHGLSPGVIMIDTNWSEYYGSLKFHREKFPDPKALMDELHEMGFKVMVWVVPFVSPDSTVFRESKAKGLLCLNSWGGVGVPEWWDGHSAMFDFTNDETVEYYHGELRKLQALGVDGFKFDGGDPEYYKQLGGDAEKRATDHCWAFAKLGLSYPLNEFRACWKMGGQPLAQRLADKSHTWDHRGLAALLPNGLAQSFMGYPYTAPDMIGGGQYTDFVEPGTLGPKPGFALDQELFVRYAQASALFPMMQFSLAPWKVLDAAHLEMCVEAGRLHVRLAKYILQLAEEASTTGEPIIRHMEYAFPHMGYEGLVDQFLLGDKILVAPILVKGKNSRVVTIPPGSWLGQDGAKGEGIVEGPVFHHVDGEAEDGAPLSSLMWFEKVVSEPPQ